MTYDEYLKQQNKATDAGNASLAATAQESATAAQGAALKPESAAVTQAQNSLQSQLQGSAQGFTSKYQPQLEALYNKVMNREKFNYDVAADPLYQQYKNQYAQMGQMAMQDTIGNASALTGGYGNSWAATAGNQAYQGYLQQLNARVPELYEGAYNRYMQEGNELQNQLALTNQLYENDLQNYWKGQEFDFNKTQADRDWEQAQHNMQIAQGNLDLNKTQAEQDYELALKQAGLAQSQFDYNKTQSEREYEMALKQLEMTQGQYGITERSAAFEQAVAMMQMGMTPSTELLALAGLTPEQAAEYVKQFKKNGTGGNVKQSEPKTAPATEPVTTGSLAGLMGAARDWFQKYYDPSKANQSGTVWDTIGKPLVQEPGADKKASDTAAKTNQAALPNYSAEQNSILKETLEETHREEVDETKYKGKGWRKNYAR